MSRSSVRDSVVAVVNKQVITLRDYPGSVRFRTRALDRDNSLSEDERQSAQERMNVAVLRQICR